MTVNKSAFLTELKIFNQRKHALATKYATDYFEGYKPLPLNKDNVEKFIFDEILQNDKEFLPYKVTKATTYDEWLKEVDQLSDEFEAFVIIKKEIEVDNVIQIFEVHLDDLNDIVNFNFLFNNNKCFKFI